MIGALHVDRAAEPALPLRDVIRDVGHEVRVRAVALAHDAILVVAELGRPEPERALVLVRVPVALERVARCARPARRCRARTRGSSVEPHAERLQVEILLLAQLRDHERCTSSSSAPPGSHRRSPARSRVATAARNVPLGDLADVLAVVAALGDRQRLARELAHAREHARPRDSRSARRRRCSRTRAPRVQPVALEQRRDRVAQRGLAAVADVQRPGRVRRHEFDVHLPPGARRSSGRIARSPARMPASPRAVCAGSRRKLMKPGPAISTRATPHEVDVETVDQLLRDVTRLALERAREHHGEVRRPSPCAGSRGRSSSGSTSSGAPRSRAARASPARMQSVVALVIPRLEPPDEEGFGPDDFASASWRALRRVASPAARLGRVALPDVVSSFFGGCSLRLLPVLPVVGDVEPRALEDEAAPPDTFRTAMAPHSGQGISKGASLILRKKRSNSWRDGQTKS